LGEFFLPENIVQHLNHNIILLYYITIKVVQIRFKF